MCNSAYLHSHPKTKLQFSFEYISSKVRQSCTFLSKICNSAYLHSHTEEGKMQSILVSSVFGPRQQREIIKEPGTWVTESYRHSFQVGLCMLQSVLVPSVTDNRGNSERIRNMADRKLPSFFSSRFYIPQ